MGGALMRGWLAGGFPASNLFVRDPAPAPETARAIAEQGIPLNFDVAELARRSPEVVVLAVKPQAMAQVVPELRPLAGPGTVFLSIAAGTLIATLEELLAADAPVVRAMPNTPASVGRGISVACANVRVSDAQRAVCADLLGAVGEVAWEDDEAAIDAATAVSGSGPAYVFYLVECLAAAGEEAGLDPALAMRLARATVSGAGEMLFRSDDPAATLRENVTSPGGTTAAALEILMGADGFSPVLRRAVAAARDRARELGG